MISPGPGRPDDAGSSLAMIDAFAGKIPVLGVCLGHQSIVQHFGGEIIGAAALMHGKTSVVQHDGATIYRGSPNPFEVGRYHSLAANREKMPPDLVVTARTTDGEIMGVRHRTLQRRRRAVPPRERADARRSDTSRELPLPLTSADERSPPLRPQMSASPTQLLERVLAASISTKRRRPRCFTTLGPGELPPALAGALLVALRAKGETAEEIRGFARGMRELALRAEHPPGAYVDIVGTGGDGSGSLNLSTGARCSRPRAACPSSSTAIARSRAAPAAPTCSPRSVCRSRSTSEPRARASRACGFTFLFAPHYHPAMKAIAPVRQALGVRTVFNILGPLANPAAPPFHVIGAFSDKWPRAWPTPWRACR